MHMIYLFIYLFLCKKRKPNYVMLHTPGKFSKVSNVTIICGEISVRLFFFRMRNVPRNSK